MALFLHRIGRAAFRRAWIVIIAWAVALGALLGLGIGLGGQLQESYAIPGTESQDAIDQLAAVFPQTAGASAKAVVEVPDGESVEDDRYRDAIEAMESDLEDVEGVSNVLGPFDEYAGDQVSSDERTAYVQVQFDGPVTEVTAESIDAVLATGDLGRDAGMQVAFGGEVFQDTTFGLTITEAIGVLFAGVVLIITFGSLLAAGMPLLTVNDPDGRSTARQTVLWAAALLPVSIMPSAIGITGWPYLAGAALFGAIFLAAAWRFAREQSQTRARKLLLASVLYLPAVFAVAVADHLLWR